jgi:FAD/FMN-containing dehydrogenase
VLRLGAGAAAATALAFSGCSSSRQAGPTTSRPAPVPTTVPSQPAQEVDWSALRAALTGRLVQPTDSGYLTDLQLYDSRFDAVHPAAIAYCATESDVQRCVAFARDHQVSFAARSGGHSYGGYSTTSGLVIDVTPMAAVSVAPGAATVGAGARLVDVYTSLNAAGVSIPAGSCPTVGIAGLTLGGGAGVVDRAYGLTCDALTGLRVVTADGRVVSADHATNADLYWACRGGGGGNFGIATSLTFRTFPTSPLTLCFLHWPWAAAADVLPAWLGWAPAAADQLWSNCLLEAAPGQPAANLQVGVGWLGPPAGVNAPLAQLEAAVGSAPSSRYVETIPFASAMYTEGGCATLSQAACHLPSHAAGGVLTRQPSLAKSGFLRRPLSDAGVQAIVAGVQLRQAQGAQGAAGFDAYGGAINQIPATATAFVHRNALASAQYNVPFDPSTPPAQLAASQAWLDSWYATLGSDMDGEAYQNYIDPNLAGWAQAYYGANLPRLQQIKRAWDPDDAFRFAQSIPLA